MIQKGALITCNGCGCSTFIEDALSYEKHMPISVVKYEAISKVFAYNQEQSESWSRVHQVMDLCPRCHKIYEEMLCKFYERCGEAGDDDLYMDRKNVSFKRTVKHDGMTEEIEDEDPVYV